MFCVVVIVKIQVTQFGLEQSPAFKGPTVKWGASYYFHRLKGEEELQGDEPTMNPRRIDGDGRGRADLSWRDGLVVKRICCYCGGPEFGLVPRIQVRWLTAACSSTLIPWRDPMLFSGLHRSLHTGTHSCLF